MKLKNILTGFMICLISSLVLTLAVFSFIRESKRPPLPILGKVDPFLLTDSKGESFSSDRLHRKVWIASFFFTTCGDICPILSKNMASLSRTFDQVEEIAFVSITVNPEQDSPEVLTRYAGNFKGGKRNWYFLTGTREAITHVVVDGFKLGDIREPVFHSASFALVDSEGKIRGYYDGTKQKEIDRLFRDTVQLAKEMKR